MKKFLKKVVLDEKFSLAYEGQNLSSYSSGRPQSSLSREQLQSAAGTRSDPTVASVSAEMAAVERVERQQQYNAVSVKPRVVSAAAKSSEPAAKQQEKSPGAISGHQRHPSHFSASSSTSSGGSGAIKGASVASREATLQRLHSKDMGKPKGRPSSSRSVMSSPMESLPQATVKKEPVVMVEESTAKANAVRLTFPVCSHSVPFRKADGHLGACSQEFNELYRIESVALGIPPTVNDMAALMDACSEGMPIFGQFHPSSGSVVKLSEGRRVASGPPGSHLASILPQIAFSNVPIPRGLKFSVKVLQKSGLSSLGIGVTTKSPESGSLPQALSDTESNHHWLVTIVSGYCLASHKGQERALQWDLNDSAGNTFGCDVSETGELHLYLNGRDVGVVWEGLPTDQPVWGVVILYGWKVEANYIIAKGHPQDYAGKTFLFVERPPEWLICAVCQALAHDPVQANCCGNIYCTRCIERWKTRSNSCPTCRSTEQSEPPFAAFQDRNARRNMLCLSTHCPNSCGKKMELSDVENHLISDNGCPDQVVDCSNKCGHKERRATVKKHMTNECRLRRQKCQYCPLVSSHEQVTGAHLEECPNYPLNCPNRCGAQGITRSTVPTHREVCPLQRVECEYKRFGCAVVLPRKDIAEHLNTSVQVHLQMTKRRVEEQEVHLQEQEVRLEEQEVHLQEQEVRLKEQEMHLQEEKAERQRMNITIAHLVNRVQQLELKK